MQLLLTPSLDRARGTVDEQAVDRGMKVFNARGCAECHAAPQYTAKETFDVEIHDAHGNTDFSPPSLRGVSQRSAYFHDNRATTLRQVFEKQRHTLNEKLPPEELNDLLAFLRSL